MDFSNWQEALYLIAGTIGLMVLIYLIVGLAMTMSLKKGIKKIWSETEEMKIHSIFWTYLVAILCWPRVDWDDVELHNNWSISIEMGKEKDEEPKAEETETLHLRRRRSNSRRPNSR